MAITFIGQASATPLVNPTAGDWTLPGGVAADDLIVFWWYTKGETKTVTEPATVTQKHDQSTEAGRLFIGYRYFVAGDTTFAWTASSVAFASTSWGTFVCKGGPTSGDPFQTQSGVPASLGEVLDIDPPATTPTDNDSLIFTMVGKKYGYATITAPTNYTASGGAQLTDDVLTGVARRILIGGGGSPENPGVFTLTGSENNFALAWTASVAPAAVAASPRPRAVKPGVMHLLEPRAYYSA